MLFLALSRYSEAGVQILMLAKNFVVILANICVDIDWYYGMVLDNIIHRH
jgi:hypothetical protein